jgi:conjugal transfer ATP-binding protein TraC
MLNNLKKLQNTKNTKNNQINPKAHIKLPYEHYDQENDLYLNSDSNIGFIFEIDPIVGVNRYFIEQLSSLFEKHLPVGGFLQFLMISQNDISPITDPWLKNFDKGDRLLKTMAYQKVQYLNTLAASENNPNNDISIKNYKILVSYGIKQSNKEQDILTLNNFRPTLESLLKSCGAVCRKLAADDFIKTISNIIYPDAKLAEFNKFNKFETISKQIGMSNSILIKSDRIQVDNYISKLYGFDNTKTNLPKKHSLYLMTKLFGDDDLQISGNMIISYIVTNNITDQEKIKLINKSDDLITSFGPLFLRPDPYVQSEIREWANVKSEIKDGKKLISSSFTVMLRAKEVDFKKAEEILYEIYAKNQLKLNPLDYFMYEAFLSCLPLGMNDSLFSLFRKFNLAKTTLSSEPLALLPIQGEYKGNGDKGILLSGRRGQLFTVDIFDRISNNNVNIIGESEDDQRQLTEEIITSYMAMGAKVIIFDNGKNYEKLCKLHEGDLQKLSSNSKIGNVFDTSNFLVTASNDQDKHKAEYNLEFFLNFITLIISDISGFTKELGDIEDGILRCCINDAWNKWGNEADLDKIVATLKATNLETALNFANKISEYLAKENYDQYSGDKFKFNFQNQLTIFELGELGDKKLTNTIMQVILTQFVMELLSRNIDKPTIIVINQASFALNYGSDFLSLISSILRRYRGSLILTSNLINDYYINDRSKSILENSGWLFMLKQKPSSVDLLLYSKRSSLDPAQAELIKSLKSIPGKYSECLISSEIGYVTGRLILDPYKQILYSTTNLQFNQVQKLIKTGISINDALKTIAIEVA